MMLDVKTSPTAVSDGIRINNPNAGNGDAILNFQNNGVDVWTIGFDDSDADALKIANGVNLTTNTYLNIETDGKVGVNTTVPNTRFHVNGAAAEDVFRLQASGATKMVMEADGQIAIGAFFSPDDQVDIRGNVQVDQGYLRVGAATTAATTRYGTFEMNWDEAFNFNSSTTQYRSMGTFDAFSKHGNTNITVTGIEWNFDGFHQDGNESPISVYITLNDGSNNVGAIGWKGWNGDGTNGPRDINWQYIDNDITQLITSDMTIKLRVDDQDISFDGDDRFYVNNMKIKIHYTYSRALQSGDIAATGQIYAQNVYSMNTTGDVAERFEINPETEAGLIVAQVPNNNNMYDLATPELASYLIGVVSKNPSVVLNEAGYGAKIGLVGRVDVKIDSKSELIKAGDPITVSLDNPGYGTKAIGNCYLIGRATKNQEKGSNETQIYLTPGALYIPELFQNHSKNEGTDGSGLEELRGVEKTKSKGSRNSLD